MTLNDFPTGQKVRLTKIEGDRRLVQKLRALGISVGHDLFVLQRRPGGLVVGRDGNRIALGAGVAEKLRACVPD